jgi:hypothetical protein
VTPTLTASRTPVLAAARPFTPVNRADKFLAALLGYRTAVIDLDATEPTDPGGTADARRQSRERIVLVHSVLARRRHRRLGAVSGRRLR